MSEDLRVTKTKKAIMETFKKMLLELDYNSINVKNLCDRALINRRTFYLHYNSLDDLLYELQEKLLLIITILQLLVFIDNGVKMVKNFH